MQEFKCDWSMFIGRVERYKKISEWLSYYEPYTEKLRIWTESLKTSKRYLIMIYKQRHNMKQTICSIKNIKC